MPYRKTKIDPPIVAREPNGEVTLLSTVEHVMDYVRRQPDQIGLARLRDAAFVAAAVPSPENIDTLRQLAAGVRTAEIGRPALDAYQIFIATLRDARAHLALAIRQMVAGTLTTRDGLADTTAQSLDKARQDIVTLDRILDSYDAGNVHKI